MQQRSLIRAAVVLTLTALTVSPTTLAHHSMARFDRCHLFTLAGEIQRVAWHNPHVEFELRTSAGITYRVLWLNLQQLKRDGVQPNALKTGDRIEITGAKQPEDNLREVALLTQIWRPSDGWRWSQPPQGC